MDFSKALQSLKEAHEVELSKTTLQLDRVETECRQKDKEIKSLKTHLERKEQLVSGLTGKFYQRNEVILKLRALVIKLTGRDPIIDDQFDVLNDGRLQSLNCATSDFTDEQIGDCGDVEDILRKEGVMKGSNHRPTLDTFQSSMKSIESNPATKKEKIEPDIGWSNSDQISDCFDVIDISGDEDLVKEAYSTPREVTFASQVSCQSSDSPSLLAGSSSEKDPFSNESPLEESPFLASISHLVPPKSSCEDHLLADTVPSEEEEYVVPETVKFSRTRYHGNGDKGLPASDTQYLLNTYMSMPASPEIRAETSACGSENAVEPNDSTKVLDKQDPCPGRHNLQISNQTSINEVRGNGDTERSSRKTLMSKTKRLALSRKQDSQQRYTKLVSKGANEDHSASSSSYGRTSHNEKTRNESFKSPTSSVTSIPHTPNVKFVSSEKSGKSAKLLDLDETMLPTSQMNNLTASPFHNRITPPHSKPCKCESSPSPSLLQSSVMESPSLLKSPTSEPPPHLIKPSLLSSPSVLQPPNAAKAFHSTSLKEINDSSNPISTSPSHSLKGKMSLKRKIPSSIQFAPIPKKPNLNDEITKRPNGADVVVSNCNLPKDYKVKVPIKKKVDRQNLDAKACQQCERWWHNGDPRQKKATCRHKSLYPPPDTPEDFFKLGFTETQE